VVLVPPRESLVGTIDDLERQQAELYGRLENRDGQLLAVRVEAMTREPGKRATAAGGASPAFKLSDSLRRSRCSPCRH
jgi:hypothetical protein